MTGPEDSHSNTRPISVAELLAKNGTIGAPPVGGRRRRRRGDTDSVTVAELTGEIPIVGAHGEDRAETGRNRTVAAEERVETTGPVYENGHADRERVVEADHAEIDADLTAEFDEDTQGDTIDTTDTADTADTSDIDEDTDDDYADAVADYTNHVESRENDVDLDFFAPPRRSSYAPRRFSAAAGAGAEQMSPDPVADDDLLDMPPEVAEAGVDHDDTAVDRDEFPSYLRSTAGPLFGGGTVADDLARRRGTKVGPEDIDLGDLGDLGELEDEDDEAAPAEGMSSFARAAWVVGQCVLAVAFGAGLFIAFDQLWKWNNIVALVLSVLVILGLVVGVRVVRKTEDIGSTLIAVAVGALVTLGPLALLQSG